MWVVVVVHDGWSQVYGPFDTDTGAHTFAARVNATIDKNQPAYAGVRVVLSPDSTDAILFAAALPVS
jgi:hypothetical protein